MIDFMDNWSSTDKVPQMQLMQAMSAIAHALSHISKETIANCWHHCGLVGEEPEGIRTIDPGISDAIQSLEQEFRRIPNCDNPEHEAGLMLDDAEEDAAYEILDDDQFLNSIIPDNTDDCLSDKEDVEEVDRDLSTDVSLRQVEDALALLTTFSAKCKVVGEEFAQTNEKLLMLFLREQAAQKKQSTLDNWFQKR
ncbi:hypothetical protein H4R20_000290 [Coemansia guatemalensis]|uniref:DDE-1 domain-containing protein n=1 Tax=Coemansia guatemalensis TaxID=2761395 RepID=A0A9W8I6J0_9FUNG|nr:hypothetical protein H4R20_000290 [Coemansia guatemalensis]